MSMKRKAIIIALIFALTFALAHQIYYSFHLTPKEIKHRGLEIDRYKNALIIMGDFKVNTNGTVDYTITSQDDTQLNYHLYTFYKEKNGKFPLYTAKELWAEMPLDTWNPPEGTYIRAYAVWAEYQGANNLGASWVSVKSNIELYNYALKAYHFPPDKQKNLSTMTLEEIARFAEGTAVGTGEWDSFNKKMISHQPITQADLID